MIFKQVYIVRPLRVRKVKHFRKKYLNPILVLFEKLPKKKYILDHNYSRILWWGEENNHDWSEVQVGNTQNVQGSFFVETHLCL